MTFAYQDGTGAGVAQPVEQRTRNAQVVGSSLTTSSIKNPVFSMLFVVRGIENMGFWFGLVFIWSL
jgi:hypothetical protein